jgi:hypothetical protein
VAIKDSGRGFYVSRPRIVAIVFGLVASPIFAAFACFGHENLGILLWLAAYTALTIAYLRPTRLRKFMQSLIPTSAEAENSRNEQS